MPVNGGLIGRLAPALMLDFSTVLLYSLVLQVSTHPAAATMIVTGPFLSAA